MKASDFCFIIFHWYSGRVSTEVASRTRSTEFIIERCTTQGTLDHDVQATGNVIRSAFVKFPRLSEVWNQQVGDTETAQASFRL